MKCKVRPLPERMAHLLARPMRFGAVGLACSGAQLGMLAAFVQLGMRHDLANMLALAFSTQLNFLLSSLIIWPDRPVTRDRTRAILQRLVAFNAISFTTLLINEGVFAVSDRFLPYLIAGICGIAVAAPINYLIEHFFIFRTREGNTEHEAPTQRLRRLPSLQ